MTVLYFAHARRITGVAEEKLTVPSSLTPSAFWDLIINRHPDLAPLRTSSRLARDHDFLTSDATLAPTDEIAVIPPVSGG